MQYRTSAQVADSRFAHAAREATEKRLSRPAREATGETTAGAEASRNEKRAADAFRRNDFFARGGLFGAPGKAARVTP